MFTNKILIYVVAGVVALSLISNIITTIKDWTKEPVYTKEAIEIMVKHAQLKKENEAYKIEIDSLKKDYEKIVISITQDSTIIHNSSRAYRDSLRNYIFNR